MTQRFGRRDPIISLARLGLFLCVLIVLAASVLALMYLAVYGGWPWP